MKSKNKDQLYKCFRCKDPAKWMRFTQFSGDHPFCTKHAKQEPDFKKSDPSYFFWDKLK